MLSVNDLSLQNAPSTITMPRSAGHNSLLEYQAMNSYTSAVGSTLSARSLPSLDSTYGDILLGTYFSLM